MGRGAAVRLGVLEGWRRGGEGAKGGWRGVSRAEGEARKGLIFGSLREISRFAEA